jgi:hypothetical protein
MTLGLAGISNVAAERRQNKAPPAQAAQAVGQKQENEQPRKGVRRLRQTLLSASYDLFEESQEHP